MIAVRDFTPDDWEAVDRIYTEGIATGVATFETDTPTWVAWDAGHLARPRLVADHDGEVAGWIALSRVSARECYRGVAEISVYVAESARRHGVGRGLLARLLEEATGEGLWMLQATVFADNDASRALHASCGFREVGRRERIAQLDGVWHDTVVLELRLP